jgi:uncharacterized GH25 family protein
MIGQDLAWRWLTQFSATGLIVLAAGSVAVALCRQPVRRARLVVFTVIGSLIVPWLGLVPLVPGWSVSRLVAGLENGARVPADRPVAVFLERPAAAPGSPPEANEPGTGRPARDRAATVARDGPGDRGAGRPAIAGSTRVVPSAWPRLALAAYAAVTAGLAALWLLGQVLLWRINGAARPVPGAVRALFLAISGPAGERVRLRVSDRIRLPFTFTWIRPVIVVPAELGDGGDTESLRYSLAHEWSHVEQHDAWAWNLVCLAGCALFFQPLFWWLRRQLRLCQDYLADDRAAACGSAEDYAAFLVRLARGRSTAPVLPALGIGDRRSHLYRRVLMLVQDHKPLERRCRRSWILAVASGVACVVLAASGLRLDASDTPSPPPVAAGDKAAAKPADAPASGEGRTWACRVVDKETGQPIAQADVLVRVSISRDKTTNAWRDLRELRQKTDAEGRYRFTVSPTEAAERLLYITLEVDAPEHVRFFGGYGYAMILKNEALGERPFYEKLELEPGKAIEGRLLTPKGEPAAGVKVQSFSSPNADSAFPDGRFAETWTDAHGRFRLVLHRKGQAVFWLLPKDYQVSTHGLKNDKRGDMGTFTLVPGIRFSGRVLDSQGKPVGGVYVSAGRETNDDGAVPSGVADMVHRSVVTAADGAFTIGPFPPGKYHVVPDERGWDPVTREGAKDPERRPLPAVFAPQTVTLKEGEAAEPLEIRAVPHVVVEAQIYDSKGKKRGGHDVWFSGEIDGEFWSTNPHPSADGQYLILAPHGLEDAMMSLTTNEHSCLQYRLSKDSPLSLSRTIRLGTLDHDVKGIEIIRYEAPIILIKATTTGGRTVEGVRISVDYTGRDKNPDGKYILKGGTRSDVSLEEMGEGRFRTSQLAPDREVTVTAKADGYAPKSETLSLPEGATRELELILEKE